MQLQFERAQGLKFKFFRQAAHLPNNISEARARPDIRPQAGLKSYRCILQCPQLADLHNVGCGPRTEATALTARFICRAVARGASLASPVTGFCGAMPNWVRAASGIILKGARIATGSAEADASNAKTQKNS